MSYIGEKGPEGPVGSDTLIIKEKSICVGMCFLITFQIKRILGIIGKVTTDSASSLFSHIAV